MIKKYIFDIPQPKSKRMVLETKKISIGLSGGFSDYCKEIWIPANKWIYGFDEGQDYEPLDECITCDAYTFTVVVTFYNSTRSKSELVNLMPYRRNKSELLY